MTFKVLGICGSLRRGSYNAMALRAAAKLAPAGMEINIAEISEIPLFNGDISTAGEPLAVAELKEKVRAADAVLLVTPEYNFSIPGVMKNALDWLSRQPAPPFEEKAIAIMGASPGPVGTARGQYHLRQVLASMSTFTVNKPEVFISHAASKFSSEGDLKDDATAKFVVQLLVSLQELALRVGPR